MNVFALGASDLSDNIAAKSFVVERHLESPESQAYLRV
jgi:hypothetical protein